MFLLCFVLQNFRTARNTRESSAMEEAGNLKMGKYTAEERKERISKYRAKRSQRNFNKTIKVCHSSLAQFLIFSLQLSNQDHLSYFLQSFITCWFLKVGRVFLYTCVVCMPEDTSRQPSTHTWAICKEWRNWWDSQTCMFNQRRGRRWSLGNLAFPLFNIFLTIQYSRLL